MDRFFWAFDHAIKDAGKSIIWIFPYANDFNHYEKQGLQLEFTSESVFEQSLIQLLRDSIDVSVCICHFVPYNTRYVSRLKSQVEKLFFVDHMSRPRISKSLRYRIWHYLKGRINSKYVDGVIAVSDFVKSRISSELGGNWLAKTQTIYNGVDFGLYQSHQTTIKPMADLFAIGFVTIDKGFQLLIQAIHLLKHDFPYISCVIAGDGPYKSDLEQMVIQLGLSSQIRFVGNVNNQYEWMRHSKVVVIPSIWYEACPFTVIESMACGSLMVVSDAGGIPELVADTALVFHKGNANALAVHLNNIFSDPIQFNELGVLAALRANRIFDLNKMVANHLDYTLKHLKN